MSYSTGTIDCSGLQLNYNIIHCIVIYKKIHIKNIVARCFISNIITELEWKREALEYFLALFESSRSRSFLEQCAVLFCCKAAWERRAGCMKVLEF